MPLLLSAPRSPTGRPSVMLRIRQTAAICPMSTDAAANLANARNPPPHRATSAHAGKNAKTGARSAEPASLTRYEQAGTMCRQNLDEPGGLLPWLVADNVLDAQRYVLTREALSAQSMSSRSFAVAVQLAQFL